MATFDFPALPHYFDRATLETATVVVVDRLPVPPLTQMGLPRLAEMERFTIGGITYLDTFLVTPKEELDESLHFHELIHVLQWRLLGPERFLACYAAGLQTHGCRASPLEAMAYDAQARFEAGVAFDAEAHVAAGLWTLGLVA